MSGPVVKTQSSTTENKLFHQIEACLTLKNPFWSNLRETADSQPALYYHR